MKTVSVTSHHWHAAAPDVARLRARREESPVGGANDQSLHPSLRELTESVSFAPAEGRIWLGERRMLLMHCCSLGTLRRELVEKLGFEGAQALLMRLGYASGVADAELVRKRCPDPEDAGAFTAGTRLHALAGMVKVTTISAVFDLGRATFRGEYLWTDGVEASEYIADYGIGKSSACWMQLGYASGYASTFLGKRVIFRELECMAMGAPACRVIGQPEEAWQRAAETVRRHDTSEHVSRLHSIPRAPSANRPTPPRSTRMIGASAALSAARHLLERVAPTRAAVLLVGESGVGKELFAQELHQASLRADKPFVAINCAAIPESLVESELFGVERGAFTGASVSRAGRFERASGGTLFLDELPSLSLMAQAKLLRAIQEQEVDRVGGLRPVKVDVRIVAATNLDLIGEVRAGRFRADLYFRLNVFPILLPPLRQRRDDIVLLLDHFLHAFNTLHDKRVSGFSPRAIEALLNYDYPGNVRELQNIVERSVIATADGDIVDECHLFGIQDRDAGVFSIARSGPLPAEVPVAAAAAVPAAEVRSPNVVDSLLGASGFSLEDFERQLYTSAMQRSGGNVAAAARSLGLTRPKLAYRLKSLGDCAEK